MTKGLIFLTLLSVLVSADDNIEIVNSGSTNTAGYTITLQRTGTVTWTVSSRFRPNSPASSNTTQISSTRMASIFQAVEAASPLSQYQPVFCVKSVSFGTTLHLQYRGQQSPDLSCPVKDTPLLVVKKYVQELIGELRINTLNPIRE